MTAFPSITVPTFTFSANEDPLATGWVASTFTGNTTNLLSSSGGVVVKNQPSATGFGSQYTSASYGPDTLAWHKQVAVTATVGQEIFGYYLRLQTPGSGAVDGYAVYANLNAGADDWHLARMIDNSLTDLTTGTHDVAAGDFVGCQVEDSAGNPVLSAYWCPAASDPTIPGSWTQVASVTDSNVAKITAGGPVGFETQGIVNSIDDMRVGTVVAAVPPYDPPIFLGPSYAAMRAATI
jgi:hypothetical protein